jgi:hypothetical protein
MTYLLQKSDQNFEASLSFISGDKSHCSAVHCAYYSCLQLMIHILLTYSGKNEKDIYDAARNDGSSHKFYIREVGNLLENRNRGAILEYNKIEDLKNYRVKSDYKNVPVSLNDLGKAIDLAQKIRSILKSSFKLIS